VLGGLLIHLLGWRSIFAVNVPLGALGVVMALASLPETPRQAGRFDIAGQLLGIGALGLLSAGLTEVGALGWGSPLIMVALLLAIIAGAGFLITERRAVGPMLPLSLFSSPTFSAATASGLLLNFGIYGQVFVLSLYFQHVRHLSALQTGIQLLPFAAMTVLGPVLVGRLTARIGPRPPMVAGQALAAVGSGLLAASGPNTAYLQLVAGLVLLGTGFALTMPSLTAAVVASAARQRAGIASGVLNASRQVGGALGVALLGSLIAGSLGITSGLHLALAIVTAGFILGATLSAAYVHSEQRSSSPNRQAASKPHASLTTLEEH
jgi:DHA2 family methylenomycin A resistance protein-like MFS transporter